MAQRSFVTACFLIDGTCKQLQRASNTECDSGESQFCGPIDPRYPGRWYLPCTQRNSSGGGILSEDFERFGRTFDGTPTILYELPQNFNSEHFVLKWYWVNVDKCNPPGLITYFDDTALKPNWGTCKGVGVAEGGYEKGNVNVD